jgi:hypothetical protein
MGDGEMLSQVTVLVPLKDNPRRTMHFLKLTGWPQFGITIK